MISSMDLPSVGHVTREAPCAGHSNPNPSISGPSDDSFALALPYNRTVRSSSISGSSDDNVAVALVVFGSRMSGQAASTKGGYQETGGIHKLCSDL